MQHSKLPGIFFFLIPHQNLEQAAHTCTLLTLQLWIEFLKRVS